MIVEARVVGEPSSIAEREVPWAPDRMLTLRALIGELVTSELVAFSERQRARSMLRVLTPADLVRGAESGHYAAEVRTPAGPPPEPAVAVARAIEAFEDGLYYVVVDGSVVSDLDERLDLKADSRLRLVRLVALAGG